MRLWSGALPLKTAPMFVHWRPLPRLPAGDGSTFAINALFETDRIEICPVLGNGCRADRQRVRAGNLSLFGMEDCGLERLRQCAEVALRSCRHARQPAALRPDVHIYVRSKLPWITLPEGAPSFDAYYDSAKLWPQASPERRRAIFG